MPPSSAMGAAHSTTTYFIPSFAKSGAFPTEPPSLPSLVSSITTPTQSRLTRRKNRLRQKILKTISKPYLTPLLPQTSPTIDPIIPVQSQPDCSPEEVCQPVGHEELKESEALEFRISESVCASNGGVGMFSNGSMLKFGMWLVGAFVFQTVCAVWVLGSAEPDERDEDLSGKDKARNFELVSNGNDEAKSWPLRNEIGNLFRSKSGVEKDGIGYVNEAELAETIMEIRAMAREAREREKLESKTSNFDGGKDDAIEKEVESRLVKLSKSLQNGTDEFLGSSISSLSKYDKAKDVGGQKSEANGALMFRKKYKFRGPLTELSNKPKGFMGSEYHAAAKAGNNSLATGDNMLTNGSITYDHAVDSVETVERGLPGADSQRDSVSIDLEDDVGENKPKEDIESSSNSKKRSGKAKGRTKLGKESGAGKMEWKSGALRDHKNGRPSIIAGEFVGSSKGNQQNSQSFTKENLDKAMISGQHAVVSKDEKLRSKEAGTKQSVNLVENLASNMQNRSWWLSLPYVMVILMRRGHDGKGPEGLFTLRSGPGSEEESTLTVAFADRGDATNFCHILQSFFQDLDDFAADIVPLSVNELDEATKLHTVKVLVVKKGQLRLYAGQTLDEVEMALRSLVGQSLGL